MADETMSRPTYYKYIVIGCGGVGSGAVYWLSKRAGRDVLGLEQFELGHEHGGSQDHSRIIRMMYNDEMYTKLTPETYKSWSTVEEESGTQLVYKTGGLIFAKQGTQDHSDIKSYLTSMKKQNIPCEWWDSATIRQRFPQFTTPPTVDAVYDPNAGLVDAALANSVHIQLARANGATVIDNSPVVRVIKLSNGNYQVQTTKQNFECQKVIVTAGAWLNNILGSFGAHIPVTVTQEQVTYFATPYVKDFTKERYPIWIYVDNGKDYYALPSHVNSYSKIGIDAGGPAVTADTRTYQPDPAREKLCVELLQNHCPKALGPIAYSKTCLYTMTKDRNFVIDTLANKGFPGVIVCCGAGHAFKFASLLGKILSEMSVDGRTQYEIKDFNINRPAVIDPSYKATFHLGSTSKY